MAEIVEYRVEKNIEELNLLVDFGLLTDQQAKEIVSKRQNYEYSLRRRTKSKLDLLKYIRFELNLLESIEKYRKSVLKNYSIYKKNQSKEEDAEDDMDHKILMLQARKLSSLIRLRAAHISSLYRKLIYSFKFDKRLWIAYIDFAKSRKWNTKTSALYWRLLRLHGDDESIWLAAAEHEVTTNKAYDTARGLFIRALRHFPNSSKLWDEYFKLEANFIELKDIDDLKKHVKDNMQVVEDLPPPPKRVKTKPKTLMDTLYECYENKGTDATRELFSDLEKSVKNQKLSLYVGMIQVEMWVLAKDDSKEQLDRIRHIYDKALQRFGESKPKLWYELLNFEQSNSKTLDDFEKINSIYARAQKTLHPSKVDRLIEKYTLLQVNASNTDIEYSDYSDLDD